MLENPRRGRQARNFTTNAPKILDLNSSSEQIFSRKLPLGAPENRITNTDANPKLLANNKFFSRIFLFGIIICSELNSSNDNVSAMTEENIFINTVYHVIWYMSMELEGSCLSALCQHILNETNVRWSSLCAVCHCVSSMRVQNCVYLKSTQRFRMRS